MAISDKTQYDLVCKAKLEKIDKKLENIDNVLRGNGNIGINTRLDRIERYVADQHKLIWLISSTVIVIIIGFLIKAINYVYLLINK